MDNRDQKLSVLDELEFMTRRREAVLYALMERQQPDFVYVVFVVLDRIHHLFGKYLDPAYRDAFRDGEIRRRLVGIYEDRRRDAGPPVGGHRRRHRHRHRVRPRLRRGTGHLLHQRIPAPGGFPPAEGGRRPAGRGPHGGGGPVAVRPTAHSAALGGAAQAVHRFGRRPRPLDGLGGPIPQQGIIVNTSGYADEAGRQQIVTDIIRHLEQVRCPDDPLTRVTRICRREELYHGPFLHHIPDILFAVRDFEYDASNNVVGQTLCDDRSRNPRGKHMPDGVFLAIGPRIEGRGLCGDVRLEQVAPSILATYGYTSERFDGPPLPFFDAGVPARAE